MTHRSYQYRDMVEELVAEHTAFALRTISEFEEQEYRIDLAFDSMNEEPIPCEESMLALTAQQSFQRWFWTGDCVFHIYAARYPTSEFAQFLGLFRISNAWLEDNYEGEYDNTKMERRRLEWIFSNIRRTPALERAFARAKLECMKADKIASPKAHVDLPYDRLIDEAVAIITKAIADSPECKRALAAAATRDGASETDF